jgi:hypothetical protein
MSVDALLLIADRLKGSLRRRFLMAVQRLRGRIDLDGIVVDIAAGNIDRAMMRLDVEALTDDLRDAATVVIDGFQKAGAATADAVNLKFRTSLAFDVTNPYAVVAARQLSARLVTNISVQTQAAIRDAVTRAFEEGLTRREVSQLIRPLIGLTPQHVQAVLKYRAEMEKNGLRTDLVLKEATKRANKYLSLRAENIARWELMSASNLGQHALWQQAIDRGLLPADVKRRWSVARDERLCKRCMAMSGQTVGMNEDFVSPLDGVRVRTPPLHGRCRCSVVLAKVAVRKAA